MPSEQTPEGYAPQHTFELLLHHGLEPRPLLGPLPVPLLPSSGQLMGCGGLVLCFSVGCGIGNSALGAARAVRGFGVAGDKVDLLQACYSIMLVVSVCQRLSASRRATCSGVVFLDDSNALAALDVERRGGRGIALVVLALGRRVGGRRADTVQCWRQRRGRQGGVHCARALLLCIVSMPVVPSSHEYTATDSLMIEATCMQASNTMTVTQQHVHHEALHVRQQACDDHASKSTRTPQTGDMV